MEQEKKSANKIWKESGSTLSFKEWIERENKKKESVNEFVPFNGENLIGQDTIQKTLDESKAYINSISGAKTASNPNLIFGLDKRVLVFSTLIIAGSLGYYFYNKLKKKA
jgi:hypothetical protein